MRVWSIATSYLAGLAGAVSPYIENLSATSLLGSHFGVPGVNASYDYLILGGGTGGLALATRLALNGSYSVAVVEAGDFYEFSNGNYTEIPAYASEFIGSNPVLKNPYLDWYLYTTPQDGLGGRSVLYPRGKVLGGSSARNFMWYHRSSRGSYKKWADLVGDSSYEFDNFLPYFEKSAHFNPPNNGLRWANSTPAYNASVFTPSGGPLQVSYPNWANPISSWIGRGLSALGLKQLPGLSDGNIEGWGYTAFTIDGTLQTRSSSETSYLRTALLQTTNLNVYKNTLAKKILFDENKSATGALVESGGIVYQLNATKEVIVSAGVFQSPQLLMVSGIGPRETLEQYNISVLSDLPGVGQNMMDHIAFSPAYAVNVITHTALATSSVAAEHTAKFINNRTGMLTNCGGDILAFSNVPLGSISSKTRAELDAFADDWPDFEHLFLDAYFGYDTDIATTTPDTGLNYVSSSAALTKPFSRGNVTISSADTADLPIINPNWLSDPRDQEVAIAAFKQARAVFTNNNGTAGVVIGAEVFPGANVSTNAQILTLIQDSAAASYHASCTCAMGLANDSMSVLDPKARVYGVQRLRVVDASAFPVLPPGHPSGTVYALAEKIAEDILQG